MPVIRIAVANIRFPPTPADSVELASNAIREAAAQCADLICFPECYVPGYRGFGRTIPHVDAAFLERAWASIAVAAAESNVGVILGTERLVDERLRISALVINRDGTLAGFQD
jgi:predicted amidohydrolase